jgi:hypothetical protein
MDRRVRELILISVLRHVVVAVAKRVLREKAKQSAFDQREQPTITQERWPASVAAIEAAQPGARAVKTGRSASTPATGEADRRHSSQLAQAGGEPCPARTHLSIPRQWTRSGAPHTLRCV